MSDNTEPQIFESFLEEKRDGDSTERPRISESKELSISIPFLTLDSSKIESPAAGAPQIVPPPLPEDPREKMEIKTSGSAVLHFTIDNEIVDVRMHAAHDAPPALDAFSPTFSQRSKNRSGAPSLVTFSKEVPLEGNSEKLVLTNSMMRSRDLELPVEMNTFVRFSADFQLDSHSSLVYYEGYQPPSPRSLFLADLNLHTDREMVNVTKSVHLHLSEDGEEEEDQGNSENGAPNEIAPESTAVSEPAPEEPKEPPSLLDSLPTSQQLPSPPPAVTNIPTATSAPQTQKPPRQGVVSRKPPQAPPVGGVQDSKVITRPPRERIPSATTQPPSASSTRIPLPHSTRIPAGAGAVRRSPISSAPQESGSPTIAASASANGGQSKPRPLSASRARPPAGHLSATIGGSGRVGVTPPKLSQTMAIGENISSALPTSARTSGDKALVARRNSLTGGSTAPLPTAAQRFRSPSASLRPTPAARENPKKNSQSTTFGEQSAKNQSLAQKTAELLGESGGSKVGGTSNAKTVRSASSNPATRTNLLEATAPK